MKKLFLSFVASVMIICSFTAQAQEYVDLGLSVNWAAYNIGAKSIEDTGTRYIGGQITEYPTSPDNKWFRQSKNLIIRHTQDYSGDPQYDAATAYWGEGWRTPKSNEWEELITRCVWKWCQYRNENGIIVKGYEITGPNGNVIFLPANIFNGKYVNGGGYQCSTPHPKTNTYATNSIASNMLAFSHKKYCMGWYVYIKANGITCGFPIRAVTDKQ